MDEQKWYEKYKQARTPDKERISKIVTDKKGAERSAAEYATAIDITAPMLSRIMRGNYAKPLTVDVLAKLSEGDDEVLRMLLRANGMISPEEQDRRQSRDVWQDRRYRFMDRERSMQTTIFSELFSREVTMKRISMHGFSHNMNNEANSSSLFNKIYTRTAIEVLGDQNYEWYFLLVPSIYEEGDGEDDIRRVCGITVERFSGLFLQDAWEPESLKNKKFSIVFAHKEYFYAFLDAMHHNKLNNCFTAILLDLNNGIVENEVSLVSKEKNKYESPFKLPTIDSNVEDGKGGFYFFFDFDDDKKEDNE